jgi:hypothetical protein
LHHSKKPIVSFGTRLIIIAVWPLVAVALVLFNRSAASAPAVAQAIGVSHQWLGILAGLYIGNFLVAWRFSGSWSNFLARSLIWGIIAYVCISNIIDLLGNNWDFAGQILGGTGGGDPGMITSIRARLGVWGVGLAMAATCIAVGFESNKSEKVNPVDKD